MRHLDRDRVPAPPCLGRYQHGRDNWNALSAEDKAQIRAHLLQLQGARCAYCEGSLDELGHHIEHLRPRGRYPKATFDWCNLYSSCYQDDSCGRYKDHRAGDFDPNQLVDPCNDDPDRFFRFHRDGSVAVREGISAADKHRAAETLRVFNLNHPAGGRLRVMRKKVADWYNGQEPDIVGFLMGLDESDRRQFVDEELARTANEPFSVVVRHFFLEWLAP